MKKYKITKEIREKIQTDSDMEDYARDNRMNLKDFELALCLYDAIGTPCEGCENIVCYNNMYPCTACTRPRKDMYKSIK